MGEGYRIKDRGASDGRLHLQPGSYEVEIGDPPIDITMKVAGGVKRKRTELIIQNGKFILHVPQHQEKRALDWAVSKYDWLDDNLHLTKDVVGIGSVIPLQGREVEIVSYDGNVIYDDDNFLHIPESSMDVIHDVKRFLYQYTYDLAVEYCNHYADMIDVTFGKINIKDTNNSWGSCSGRTHNLNFNYRLVLGPPEALEYVCVHEVAHRRELNHDPEFWDLCVDMMPDALEWESWLRVNGNRLMGLNFDD